MVTIYCFRLFEDKDLKWTSYYKNYYNFEFCELCINNNNNNNIINI
jgi:hypothetical protein